VSELSLTPIFLFPETVFDKDEEDDMVAPLPMPCKVKDCKGRDEEEEEEEEEDEDEEDEDEEDVISLVQLVSK
jgi:hypothetical protein